MAACKALPGLFSAEDAIKLSLRVVLLRGPGTPDVQTLPEDAEEPPPQTMTHCPEVTQVMNKDALDFSFGSYDDKLF